MRILVVEDEHKIANSIKKGLEQELLAVDVVFTGNEGYDLASVEDYDLIVLDLLVPGMNGRPISGEILSSDDKSITVKLQDGSSKIVLLSDKTQINKATSVTKLDLKSGEKVAVFGSENSDGSVTAQNIQLNPQFRGVGSSSASPR